MLILGKINLWLNNNNSSYFNNYKIKNSVVLKHHLKIPKKLITIIVVINKIVKNIKNNKLKLITLLYEMKIMNLYYYI